MIKPIQAKTMLSPIKKGSDRWFGLRYNMNLYRGCQHQCIYCDSRSECYQLHEFCTHIYYKENAIELLRNELPRKREVGTVGFGSMNDPYMPLEKDLKMTQQALQVMAANRFPVHIITKSNLVVRDIDILKQISKFYCAISFTITTTDDHLAKKIEPGAPAPSKRFEAIRKLSNENIYTGVTLMPLLPMINATKENLESIVVKAKKAGAKYIIPGLGLTLRDGSREYFFQALDRLFPGKKEKYIKKYGYQYQINPDNSRELYVYLNKLSKKYDIPLKMKFYEKETTEQLTFL